MASRRTLRFYKVQHQRPTKNRGDLKSKYSTPTGLCDHVSKVTANEILGTVEPFAHPQHVTTPYRCLAARASVGFDSEVLCRPHCLD